jgi:hypothetical protein
MDKMHHPSMANGKNVNAQLALSRVWTTFPFIVQWISHETTKTKKHNKSKHNTHLFNHMVHNECWVNCSFFNGFEIHVALMLTIINCCLLMGMFANVYPPPSPPSWSHPRAKGHWELFWGNIKLIIETCTFFIGVCYIESGHPWRHDNNLKPSLGYAQKYSFGLDSWATSNTMLMSNARPKSPYWNPRLLSLTTISWNTQICQKRSAQR